MNLYDLTQKYIMNGYEEPDTDITHLLLKSDSFIKKPNEELPEFLNFDIPNHTIDDIYKNLTSLWISKIKENEFIIKLSVSNEVFTYFKIVFEK